MNSFGEFLKQKRQEKKLTQKELAGLLFVSESAVSKWEKNVAHPDITLLPKLSEILDVTEHELITASVDKLVRDEKKQAKKWRIFSFSWSLFFYISYALALIPCFICNLAISKTLSWFWIVLSALMLAFTFTNLPKLIKKHKLLLLPLSMFFAFCILLATCAIYTKGDWFFIVILPILLGLMMVFVPIYISKYKIFLKIKKYNDFVSVAVVFVMLNVLLIVIDFYTIVNGYALTHWYFSIAFPIVLAVYLILNILLSMRFLKINKLFKTSIILILIDFFTYGTVPFVKVENSDFQKEINDLNVFNANFSRWTTDGGLENNIHCIVCLTVLFLAVLFFVFGLICHLKTRKQKKI